MNPIRLAQQMKFIAEIDKLKQVVRESWLVDASRKETDAEHSWHITVMALLLREYANHDGIDILKVMKMLLIHDVVEIDAGDTFIYDKDHAKDQNNREQKAANRLFGLLPADQREEFMALWEEFEAKNTPEAMFARAIDSIQPLLLAYLNGGCSWRIHSIIKSQVIETKKHMGKGSSELWKYTQELLDDAAKKGILKS
ncbi:MAG: HD domain-containing protein [Candidatus Hermodarchaeia archaeon]|jgi:putative hydrolase of HD superfamily